MTLYQFYCFLCDRELEINVPMNQRDEPRKCKCENLLQRKVSFKGMVYSGTANGGMK